MLFAVPAISGTNAPPVAVVPDPAPSPITAISLSGGVVDWSSYVTPSDFAGYDIRYTTVLGQSWAAATDLAPGLQIQNTIAVSAFPAAALECLVVPVDVAGHIGFPEARQALVVVTPPPAITQIALQSDRVAWTYTPPANFAGYDVRYATVLGGSYATATKLYPALRTAAQSFALLSDFPAAALECLVEPVNTGGAFGTPEARQGIAPPTNLYALGPAAAFAANWTAQPGDATVVITNEAGGVVVDCTRNGSPPDAATTPFLTLWGKTALPAGRDWTLKSRWTQLDTNATTQADGIFVQIQAVTGGPNGSDANPNLWTTAQYQDAALTYRSTTGGYDKYSNGWRFSFDQDATNTANNDQLRGHSFTGGTEAQLGVVGTSYGVQFPFVANVAYDITVQWRSATNTLTWTIARADGTGTATTVPVVDTNIAGVMGAYLGFNVSPGRMMRIENASLTDDGSGGPPPPPPPSGEAWRDDTTQWAQILPLAQVSAGSIVHINSNSDLALLNPGTPGKTYVLGANLTGSVTVTGQGTKANPIIIRGDYDGTNPANFRKWTYSGNTNLLINGASHVYVTKLCFVGSASTSLNVNVTGSATRVSIERCWSYGQSSGGLYDTAPYGIDSTANIRFFRIRYCEHGNASVQTPAGMWTMHNPQGNNFPLDLYFYRNLIHDISDSGISSSFGSVIFSIGRGAPSSDVNNRAAFYENRLRAIIHHGETMEMKCAGAVMAYNTLDTSSDNITLRARNGLDTLVIGNVFNTGGFIECRGTGHRVLNNWSVSLAAGVQVTAGSALGSAGVRINAGNCDGSISFTLAKPDFENYSGGLSARPNCIAAQVGGNRMPVVIANETDNDGYSGKVPVLGSPLNVVGPAASGSSVSYRNRSITVGAAGDKDYAGRGQTRKSYSGSPAYGTPVGGSTTVSTKAITGADYDKVPTRLFDADVGIACTVYP